MSCGLSVNARPRSSRMAESLGASYKGQQTGTFGTYNAISFNGNKITGSAGDALDR